MNKWNNHTNFTPTWSGDPSFVPPNTTPVPVYSVPQYSAPCPGCGRCPMCGRPADPQVTITWGNTNATSQVLPDIQPKGRRS